MNRTFITELENRIRTIPSIRHVGIHNNDVEQNATGEGTQYALPAVFISFPEGSPYEYIGAGVQRTDKTIVRLVIVSIATSKEYVLQSLDLKQVIYDTIQKWNATNSGPMTRVHEYTDEDHTQIFRFEQDYEVSIRDDSNNVDKDKIGHFPWAFVINGEFTLSVENEDD